jgi:hypothetical protein
LCSRNEAGDWPKPIDLKVMSEERHEPRLQVPPPPDWVNFAPLPPRIIALQRAAKRRPTKKAVPAAKKPKPASEAPVELPEGLPEDEGEPEPKAKAKGKAKVKATGKAKVQAKGKAQAKPMVVRTFGCSKCRMSIKGCAKCRG